MNFNEKLFEIYKENINILNTNSEKQAQVTHPFLLSIPDDCGNKIKIMIFGQETNDWGEFSDNNIEKKMDAYKNFWFDKNSKFSKVGTFQQVLTKFQNMLEIDKTCCIWNNTIKIGKRKDKGIPSQELLDWQENWFDVVKQEVELLKPDFIIFFNANKTYDKYIEKSLGKYTQSKYSDKYKKNAFSKLVFEDYKEIKVFRTYHPNYLRRSKLENEILNLLIKEIKKDL